MDPPVRTLPPLARAGFAPASVRLHPFARGRRRGAGAGLKPNEAGAPIVANVDQLHALAALG